MTKFPENGQNANQKETRDRKSSTEHNREHSVGFATYTMTLLAAPAVHTQRKVFRFLDTCMASGTLVMHVYSLPTTGRYRASILILTPLPHFHVIKLIWQAGHQQTQL